MSKEELLAKANTGDAMAVEVVANSYYRGLNGFEENNDQAFKWFLRAERLNSKGVVTLNGLGGCYYFGYGTAKNQAKGLAYWRKAAELGYKNAQYNLADKPDKSGNSECLFWYAKAAQQDYGEALYRLFEIYRDGEMIEQDLDKAVWCLERAAQVMCIDAMLTLGYHYGNGDGSLVPKDNEKALFWTLAAANESSSAAMNNLAISYRTGDFVKANIDTAIQWAKKAAENGDGDQLFYIAVQLKNGQELAQDANRAYELFRFGAEHGHDRCIIQMALYELGGAHTLSNVTPKAARASLEWAKKAAAIGNETGFTLILRMGDVAYGEEAAKKVYFETAKEGADNGCYYCMYEVFRCYSQGYGTEANPEKALEYIQRAANDEWPRALYELANLYKNGHPGIKVDKSKAFELYKRASDRDCIDAYGSLADCYKDGIGTVQDLKEAIKWYQKSVEDGNDFFSASSLFNLYLNGQEKGIEPDIKAALKYGEKAYELGKGSNPENPLFPLVESVLDALYSNEKFTKSVNPESAKQFYLEKATAGDPHAMYEMGRFLNGNVDSGGEGLHWLVKAAYAGEVQAQFRLGVEYMLSNNDSEAAKYLEMGAAQNHPGCLIYMGSYLENGSKNVPQNSARAFKYYCRAADQDSPLGNYHKGLCYLSGRGTQENHIEAFSAFKKAQELGCEEMWSELGGCYLDGIGTNKDMKKALWCYHQGADGNTHCPICTWKLGLIYSGAYDQRFYNANLAEKYLVSLADSDNENFNADAQFALGLLYSQEGNTQGALTRWEQAANNGSASAQYNIGIAYLNGQDVPKDLNQALYFLQLAAAQGHERAMKAIQNLRSIQARPERSQQQTPNTHRQASTSQSSQSSSSGCYVATCVYGSYDCPEVWILRRYRDYTLAQTWYGRLFIKTYYFISPRVVKALGKYDWLKHLWKGQLDRFVNKLQEGGFESTPYNDK